MSFFNQNKSSFASISQGQARPSFLGKGASGGTTVAVDQEFKSPSFTSLSIGSNSFLRERDARDSISCLNNSTIKSDISRTHYNQNNGDDVEDNISVLSERDFEFGNDLAEQNWAPQRPYIGHCEFGETHEKLNKLNSETFVYSSNRPQTQSNNNGQEDEKTTGEKSDSQKQMENCNEDLEYSDTLASKNHVAEKTKVTASQEEKNVMRFPLGSTFLHESTESTQRTIPEETRNSQQKMRRISHTFSPLNSDIGFDFATPKKWSTTTQLNSSRTGMEKNDARSSTMNKYAGLETPGKDPVPFLFREEKAEFPNRQGGNNFEMKKWTPNIKQASAVTSEVTGTTEERKATSISSNKSNTNRFSPTPYSTNNSVLKTPSILPSLFKKPSLPFSEITTSITTTTTTASTGGTNYHSAVSSTNATATSTNNNNNNEYTTTTTTTNNNNSNNNNDNNNDLSDNNDKNENNMSNSISTAVNSLAIPNNNNNKNPLEITLGQFLPALSSPLTPNSPKKRKQSYDNLRNDFYEESKLQRFSYANKHNSTIFNNNSSKSMEEYLTSILEKNEIRKQLQKQKENLQSQRFSVVSETARLLQHDTLPVATAMLLDCLQKVSDIR